MLEKKLSGAGERKKNSWVEAKNQVLEKKTTEVQEDETKLMGVGKKSSAGEKKINTKTPDDGGHYQNEWAFSKLPPSPVEFSLVMLKMVSV